MSDAVYMVRKEAVYYHECCGIFTTLEAAKECAYAVAVREDGHHEVVVYPFTLNVPGTPTQEPDDYGYPSLGVNEPEYVLACRKYPKQIRGDTGGEIQWSLGGLTNGSRYDWQTITEAP